MYELEYRLRDIQLEAYADNHVSFRSKLLDACFDTVHPRGPILLTHGVPKIGFGAGRKVEELIFGPELPKSIDTFNDLHLSLAFCLHVSCQMILYRH